MIKNFDPTWVLMEVTAAPIVNPQTYQNMETYYSGLSFHLYIIDYDQDGYNDFVIPDLLGNQLVSHIRNPGHAYWNKISHLKD